ncbi:MAG: hypothetical protein AAGH64_12495 [Planctomycetota bacterium]
MSQLGMQMPGRRRTRPATPNVYTGMLAAACAALIGAIVLVGLAGIKVGPGSGVMAALTIHGSGTINLDN